MKKPFILVLFITISHLSQSQYALPVDDYQLNAGLGLSGWGIPVYVGIDRGVHRDISAGLEASFRTNSEIIRDIDYKNQIFGFSANGNYHFNGITDIPEQFDLYAGLSFGFYIWNSPHGYDGPGTSAPTISAQGGARYYFNDKIAINVELGGGGAFGSGKFGITVKL